MESKDILRITLAQVDLIWESPAENRLNLESKLLPLSGKTDLVIFPETFTTGFSVNSLELAEEMDGPTIAWLLRLSASTGIAIGGSLLIKEKDKLFNRFVFVTPQGEIFHYDKRHLFSMGGESDLLNSGNKRTILDYLGWKIALYTCYDIRFPVWCRNLNDTDLIIFTANWPAARSNVWNTLLKARAIENQVYVAGINRIGTDGNSILYTGDSQVINARGEELIPTYSDAQMLLFEISKKALIDFREKFPVANDADLFTINL